MLQGALIGAIVGVVMVVLERGPMTLAQIAEAVEKVNVITYEAI